MKVFGMTLVWFESIILFFLAVSCVFGEDYSAEIKWEYPIGSYISFVTSPTIDFDGTIYVGTTINETMRPGEGGLYAFSPDGTLKWIFSDE